MFAVVEDEDEEFVAADVTEVTADVTADVTVEVTNDVTDDGTFVILDNNSLSGIITLTGLYFSFRRCNIL